jgi:hypothetical protein
MSMRKNVTVHETWAEATRRQREALLQFAGVPADWLEILAHSAWEELRPLTQAMLRKGWDGPVTEG